MAHTRPLITIPTPEDLTRREFLSSTLAAALLVACGSDDDEAPASNGGTRRVDHVLGSTDVPLAPQRVAALNLFAFDAAVNLGIIPVVGTNNVSAPLQDRLADVETVVSGSEPDMEAIVAASPDLVLAMTVNGEPFPLNVQQLEVVAPVIVHDASSAGWKEAFLSYADALSKGAEGDALMTAYDARTAELREALGESVANTTVRIVRPRNGGLDVYLRTSFPGTILDDVGFARPEGEPLGATWETLSLERIPEVDADHIFLWSYNDTERQFLESEVLTNPLWERLEAVRRGNVYIVGNHWIGSGVTPADQVLDDLFAYLVTR